MRETHAFSHAPKTLPAHASILTWPHAGAPAQANGAARLADDVPTLATVIRRRRISDRRVRRCVRPRRASGSVAGSTTTAIASRAGEARFLVAERRAEAVVKAAGDWILGAAPSPWFAWVHLFDPHAPYDAPRGVPAGRHHTNAEVAYTDAMLGQLLDRLRSGHALDRRRSS